MLRINLLDSFSHLQQCLLALNEALQADHTQALWVALSDAERQRNRAMRDKLLALYQMLYYEDGQDGRETVTCAGIVGAGEPTLAAATRCNEAKDQFKAAVLALKNLRKAQADALMADLHSRNEAVGRMMRRMGVARLNLKQVYRHIPILMQRPVKISFTWSKQGRTIQRTTVAEARRLLERRNQSLQASSELERLATIPPQEILARVRPTVPHLRANIVHRQPDGQVDRRLMQAPLPILIPSRPGEPLPEYIAVGTEPGGQQRVKRSDVRIEEEPFLPLIRIHRYVERYRQSG